MSRSPVSNARSQVIGEFDNEAFIHGPYPSTVPFPSLERLVSPDVSVNALELPFANKSP